MNPNDTSLKLLVKCSLAFLIICQTTFAQRVVPVTASLPDALFNAVAAASAGDILTLESGGTYPNSAPLAPTKAITIKTADGYTRKATCLLIANQAGSYGSGNFLTMAEASQYRMLLLI